jgi:predicted O-methyltransferase YrrM
MLLHRILAIVPLVFGLLTVPPAGAQAPTLQQAPPPQAAPPLKREPDVPYVPTDERVVAEMLKVAKVKKSDVLYDLGSGDGRIVITAARRFGTRGTGVDIDPERVREAQENAEKAGVSDRVRFIHGDLFEMDLRDATVVTLYLLPAVNLKLRPKLLRELRPGTRVVSHNYDMGDWMPDKTIRVKLPDGVHVVYYWVVPARSRGAGR